MATYCTECGVKIKRGLKLCPSCAEKRMNYYAKEILESSELLNILNKQFTLTIEAMKLENDGKMEEMLEALGKIDIDKYIAECTAKYEENTKLNYNDRLMFTVGCCRAFRWMGKQIFGEDWEEQNLKQETLIANTHLRHIKGLPFLGFIEVKVELFTDRLVVVCKSNRFKINLEQIIDISIKKESEISEKERHTILRAIGGGLVAGGIGSIVGALSGVSSKKIKETSYFVSLNYISTNDEHKNIMFLIGYDMTGNLLSSFQQKFIDEVKKQIDLVCPKPLDSKGEMEL